MPTQKQPSLSCPAFRTCHEPCHQETYAVKRKGHDKIIVEISYDGQLQLPRDLEPEGEHYVHPSHTPTPPSNLCRRPMLQNPSMPKCPGRTTAAPCSSHRCQGWERNIFPSQSLTSPGQRIKSPRQVGVPLMRAGGGFPHPPLLASQSSPGSSDLDKQASLDGRRRWLFPLRWRPSRLLQVLLA